MEPFPADLLAPIHQPTELQQQKFDTAISDQLKQLGIALTKARTIS